jgi:hypothetical protein
VQQHFRALKAMGHEPSGCFVTSVLELKLDAGTMFLNAVIVTRQGSRLRFGSKRLSSLQR